jgi:hypothetical protein
VALVLAGDQANGPEVACELTSQFDEVRRLLEKAQPGNLATDINGSVRRAEELASSGKTRGGTAIYVFSDLQDSGWSSPDRPDARAANLETAYFFISCRPTKEPVNRAVTALKYPATRPRVGVPFAVQSLVALLGDDRKDVAVKFHVDDEKVGEQQADRLPGNRADLRWATARFYHTFQKPGWHSGYVEIDPDNLQADNKRYFTIEVPESTRTVPVLAVNGSPSQIPREDELFFLRLALESAPEGEQGSFAITPIAPNELGATLGRFSLSEQSLSALRADGFPETLAEKVRKSEIPGKEYDTSENFLRAVEGVLPPEEVKKYQAELLNRARGGDYPLLILANVDAGKLTEAAVEKLEEYVDGGGKLLIFLGDKVTAPAFNNLLAGQNRRHQGLSPGRLKGAGPVEGGHIKLPKSYEHRALASFNEPKLRALLGPSVTFKKVLPLEVPADNVLMETSTGQPLLCEKPYGKGKVLLFASTCDRDWTDFPIRPAFPLWSRFLADYLTQTPLNLQSGISTGDAVRLPAPTSGDKGTLFVRKPNKEKVAVPRSNDGSGTFEFRDTAEPGVYAVLSAEEKPLGLFAVNLEGHESDLSYLDDPGDDPPEGQHERVVKDLKTALGGPPLVTYTEDVGGLKAALGDSRRGMKLWDIVLVVVLLIGLFEPWLANQISARLYARPKDVQAVGLAAPAVRVGPAEPVAEGAVR